MLFIKSNIDFQLITAISKIVIIKIVLTNNYNNSADRFYVS